MSATSAAGTELLLDAAFAEQLEATLDDLAPLFTRDPARSDLGRRLALRAIMSYAPACDADLLSIGQVIAISKTTLALLRQAADPDQPHRERMQSITRAQSLSRSAMLVEGALDRRRQRQAAGQTPVAEQIPVAEQTSVAERTPETEQTSVDAASPRQRFHCESVMMPTEALPPMPAEADAEAAMPQDPRIEAMRQFAHLLMATQTAMEDAEPLAPEGVDPEALAAFDPWALLQAHGVLQAGAGTLDTTGLAGAQA